MAQKAAHQGATEIDPMFAIPEGVSELVYTEGGIESSQEFEGGESLGDDYIDDGYTDNEDFSDYSDEPATPDILGVVSQTLRTSPSGAQVVDLVVEVDDIDGATNYEVRVTKA